MTLILSGTNGLSDVDGSAATPAIRGTDTNTGMFFPAADTVGIATGGSEQMRLTSTGLGIGTSSVTSGSKLDVNGQIVAQNGSTSSLGYSFRSATTTGLYVNDDGVGANLVLQANGSSNYAYLSRSGNLGLGVTPSAWSVGKVFEMRNAGNAVFTNGAGELYMSANAYYNGGWLYGVTGGYAAQYICGNTNGTHIWKVASASGTAGNTISFTQAMTLDASGNLMVGATSNPNTYKIYAKNNNTNTTSLVLENNNGGYQVYTSNQELAFFQLNVGERARIDSSGNLLVGTTTSRGRGTFFTSSGNAMGVEHSGSGTVTALEFRQGSPSAACGSITMSFASSTAYNTSSDYRLKENIAPMTGALAKVAALKPCTYKWKANGLDGEGFIAHELAEVVPQCVTGEKDAVDEQGNPKYQGIDTSFLVATLTAALQELKAIVDAQAAEIATLKGQA